MCRNAHCLRVVMFVRPSEHWLLSFCNISGSALFRRARKEMHNEKERTLQSN
jgi:hypothetical protein